MPDVTQILSQIEQGDPQAAEKLLPLVYDELRKLAAAKLAQEKPGQTLQATALVHEAYLRLVGGAVGNALCVVPGVGGQESGVRNDSQQPTPDNPRDHRSAAVPATPAFNSRGHFFGAAAEAMRRVLIDRARDRKRLKREGGRQRLNLDEIEVALDAPVDELLALNELLDQLVAEFPDCGELVKLRFFAGLPLGEAAAALGIPRRTADRNWAFARAWLHRKLQADDPAVPNK